MPGWNDQQTARSYDHYAHTFSTYKETNRDLVRVARIEDEMEIVDLACGTGMTTAAILSAPARIRHIFAVDGAEAMLAVAMEAIDSPRVSFHLSQAEALVQVIPHRVDRVLCNSAFWQVDADQTLAAIKQILKPDGLFVFNLPDMFGTNPNNDEMPNIRLLMRQVARETYGFVFPDIYSSTPRIFSGTEAVLQLLSEHGYQLMEHQQRSYQGSRQEVRAFYSIPIMTERALPDVDYATRMKILEEVFAAPDLDISQETETVWDTYVVRVGG